MTLVRMRTVGSAAALGIAMMVSPARADMFDGLGNRLGRLLERRVERTSDLVVGGAFNRADEAVTCATGDRMCARSERAGQETRDSAPSPGAGGAKCLATDVSCLEQAAERHEAVVIVAEADLEMRRCAARDRGCLERARRAGKPVEIIR
jgi:hypothetical protein